jgi:putative ABC transport system permease protein
MAAVLARRCGPAIVIGLVLAICAAASLLAAAVVVDVRGPFDQVFAVQHGAQVTATVDLSRVTMGQLAATARWPGVAAAAGPFAETTIGRPGSPVTARLDDRGGKVLTPMTLAGRASPGGPVDDLTLVAGHWARLAGQIVLRFGFEDGSIPVGSWIAVTGLPRASRLEVVGLAVSISGSADAWVIPPEIARLRLRGTPATAQLLYRFDGATTSAAIGADVAAVRAALPAGAVAGTRSYLTVKAADTARVAAYLPVLVACGLIGLVLAVLTMARVIGGAVAAGSARTRILKVIGFSPAQIAAVYAGLGLVPAAGGCLAGILLGNLLARPLLTGAAYAFGPGVLGVPAWVTVDVAVVVLALTALAALAPARRLNRVP